MSLWQASASALAAYSDGARVTRTWDPAGRLALVEDAEGATTTTYDPVGRVTEVVNPYGQSLSYSYDNVGNRLLTQDPSGTLTTYTYDELNQVTEITNPFGEVTAIEYDELGREKRKVLANGMAVSHTYDEAGRQTLLAQHKEDGTPLAVYTATYDPTGNRTQVEELDGAVVSYSYDAAGQLTREQRSGANAYDTSYTYDAAGNRLTKEEAAGTTAYDYDAANQLLVVTPPSGDPTTHTWDRNGNLHVENCGGALTTYTWDDDNRLVGVSHPNGEVETLTYDAGGLRRKRVTPSGGIIHVRDGQNVLVDTDASLVVQAHYTDWPGEWGGLVSQRRGEASSFFGFDLQSSTRLLVSVAGEVTDAETFKAFGESLASSGTTEHPFRYVGEQGYQWDEDGRYYVRARYLDVADGRWLSRDPEWDGTNWYAYMAGDPVWGTDPSGRKPGDPYPGYQPDFPPAAPGKRPLFQTPAPPASAELGITDEEFWRIVGWLSYVPGVGTPADVALILRDVAQGNYRGAALQAIGLVPLGHVARTVSKVAKPVVKAAGPRVGRLAAAAMRVTPEEASRRARVIREWADELAQFLPRASRFMLTRIAAVPAKVLSPTKLRGLRYRYTELVGEEGLGHLTEHELAERMKLNLKKTSVALTHQAIDMVRTMTMVRPGVVRYSVRVKAGVKTFEARAIRKLSHLSDRELFVMARTDGGPRVDGKPDWTVVLHHHQQNPGGPLIEIVQPPKGSGIPAQHHSKKRGQHPQGTSKGAGLAGFPGAREEFDDEIQPQYWRMMAANELLLRCQVDPRCLLKRLGFLP